MDGKVGLLLHSVGSRGVAFLNKLMRMSPRALDGGSLTFFLTLISQTPSLNQIVYI